MQALAWLPTASAREPFDFLDLRLSAYFSPGCPETEFLTLNAER